MSASSSTARTPLSDTPCSTTAGYPGGWCSPENLDCAAYYPHFGEFLLNRRHEILPGVEAIRQKARLFAGLGRNGFVFARPTSVHKLFVGRLIAEDDFETALAPTRYDPESVVLVAPPCEIGREWRLVVAGDEVIAGSQYADGGVRSVSPDCPPEVFGFVRGVLTDARWRPDDVFMFQYPRYVIKGGEVVVEEGDIRHVGEGREFVVRPAYDERIADYLRPLFQQYYTMSFDNYPVEMERIEHPDVRPTSPTR